jgi:hypothetical protein
MTGHPPGGPRLRVLGRLDTPTAAAVDHVLLGYDYLRRHDLDGFLSLVEADVLACLTPDRVHRGRAELAAHLTGGADGAAALHPEEVIALSRSVVVVRGDLQPCGTEVVDTVVTGPHGLIRSCLRSWPAA